MKPELGFQSKRSVLLNVYKIPNHVNFTGMFFEKHTILMTIILSNIQCCVAIQSNHDPEQYGGLARRKWGNERECELTQLDPRLAVI